jgi:hypothetical protein
MLLAREVKFAPNKKRKIILKILWIGVRAIWFYLGFGMNDMFINNKFTIVVGSFLERGGGGAWNSFKECLTR